MITRLITWQHEDPLLRLILIVVAGTAGWIVLNTILGVTRGVVSAVRVWLYWRRQP